MRSKILIADDDELLRALLAKMLSDYIVIDADNGKDAVRLYDVHRPDLVLMDVKMPVMDGIEATKLIIEKHPEAKILAITAYAPQKGDAMLEAGAREIITKPITRKKLNEIVEKHLRMER
jgi:CheY-like chemotaxis protein